MMTCKLGGHENDGRQYAPVSKRVLEEALIHVEADEELVRRSIRQDQPTTGGDECGDDRNRR